MKIKENALISKIEERSSIYRFLSQVYSGEPDKDFLENFRNSGLLETLKELGIDLGQDFRNAPLRELADELSVEYTRLFIGPGGHIYPYESAYRKDKESASLDTATEVKRFIEFHGLKYKRNFTEQFDHISVELEFMERVLREEQVSLKKKDIKEAAGFSNLGKKFIKEHLVKWLPEFSDKTINAARLSFYREIAKLTKEFILLEGTEKHKGGV